MPHRAAYLQNVTKQAGFLTNTGIIPFQDHVTIADKLKAGKQGRLSIDKPVLNSSIKREYGIDTSVERRKSLHSQTRKRGIIASSSKKELKPTMADSRASEPNTPKGAAKKR